MSFQQSQNKDIIFLILWASAVNNKNSVFGFRGINTFSDELILATDFISACNKKWINLTLNNLTALSFNDFFMYEAKNNGIDIQDDFSKYISKHMEDK